MVQVKHSQQKYFRDLCFVFAQPVYSEKNKVLKIENIQFGNPFLLRTLKLSYWKSKISRKGKCNDQKSKKYSWNNTGQQLL